MSTIPAVVTGLGPISAIGCNRNEFWNALMEGQHGFGPITQCDDSLSPSKIAAEVKDFKLERYIENGSIMARKTPRPAQFALASAVLALHDAEIALDSCDPDRLGVLVGTSLGNIETSFSMQDTYRRKGKLPPHAAFYAFNHSAACMVSSFFNIRGPIFTTTSGCNSGLDALGQALRMIQSGAVDAMLVIGTDCELVPEVLAALNASGSLTTKYNDNPGEASRPFDKNRDGNVIGEGAAALLLESESHARARSARIYARVVGYQMCSAGQNRQYSHDNPEPDIRPCVRALESVIKEAGWRPNDVDVINANGSSSVIYDRLEAIALSEVFGRALSEIPTHSIKSMLGQHGAGSSALQAVTTCLSLRRGSIPPTINHTDPGEDCERLRISSEPQETHPQKAVIHSIGLGGFYHSAAALQTYQADTMDHTGAIQVEWSEEQHPQFKPSEEFKKPLEPWKPVSEK